MGRQAASFHYRRCSRASHVQYIQYVILPGRSSRQRRHAIHLQYCVYTVYILYIHGALARQMKMFWNRNASSQLCEQCITHVYVQYSIQYSIYIQYIYSIHCVYIRCACAPDHLLISTHIMWVQYIYSKYSTVHTIDAIAYSIWIRCACAPDGDALR